MAIMPTSKLRLLHNVPLYDYEHTVIYNDSTSQYNDFMTYLKYNIGDDFTFIRDNGSVKVALPIGSCYDINYIMFQNSSYSNKWFYAFVTAQNYVNDETTELEFTVDEMQSWMFEYSIEESFVEREHVMDDTIGAHTVPEGLETGDYIGTGNVVTAYSELGVYAYLTEDLGDEMSSVTVNPPSTYGRLPITCYWTYLGNASDVNTPGRIKELADTYASKGKSDAIICMFTQPNSFVPINPSMQAQVQSMALAPRTLSKTPKNNKLYTYPYCACIVESPGQSLQLKYELMKATTELSLRCTWGPGCKVMGNITDYNDIPGGFSYAYQMTLGNFPLMAWTSNAFQNWLALNKASIVTNVVGGLASTIGGIATGNLVNKAVIRSAKNAQSALSGTEDRLRIERARYRSSSRTASAKMEGAPIQGAISVGQSVLSTLVSVYEHSLVPDTMNGSANASDVNSANGSNGFRSYCVSIKPEFVTIIDNYFEHYGYKVNAMKVPNISGRPHWNYVKTIGANVHGTAPSQTLEVIRSVLDSGVTFWKSLSEVENYSLNNH